MKLFFSRIFWKFLFLINIFQCIICLFLFSFLTITKGAESKGSSGTYRRSRPMMGTFVEITVCEEQRSRANDAIDIGFAAIAEADRLLSSHRPDSELNAINAAAGQSVIAVSPWTYECIVMGIQIGRQSRGAFDITCRPILDLWGFIWKQYRMPKSEELRAVLPLVNYADIIVLENSFSTRSIINIPQQLGRYRVGLARRGMKLDVGGIGKGFAVDKAVEAIKATGIQDGLVCAGGDFRGFGLRSWKIGIADPSNPKHAIREFEICNQAVSTSGDYEIFFSVQGHRYSHIINPKTGWPVTYCHSVTVQAPSATLADGWCEPLFVQPKIKLPSSIQLVDMR